MKRYSQGIVFDRPYQVRDWCMLALVSVIGGGVTYYEERSLIGSAVVFMLLACIHAWFFRPAFGYLNIRHRLAMSSSFRRLPFDRISLPHESDLLTVREKATQSVLFRAPGVTAEQFSQIRAAVETAPLVFVP